MSAITPDEAALRSSRAALATLLMVMVINMLGFGVIVPLLPFYARSFHAPAWQIGLLFSAYSAGSFFGEPFWGRLSTVSGASRCWSRRSAPTASATWRWRSRRTSSWDVWCGF